MNTDTYKRQRTAPETGAGLRLQTHVSNDPLPVLRHGGSLGHPRELLTRWSTAAASIDRSQPPAGLVRGPHPAAPRSARQRVSNSAPYWRCRFENGANYRAPPEPVQDNFRPGLDSSAHKRGLFPIFSPGISFPGGWRSPPATTFQRKSTASGKVGVRPHSTFGRSEIGRVAAPSP